MLTINKVKDVAGGSRYYAQDNYYTQDQGVEHSEWYGRGAQALELEGKVDPAVFSELLGGQVDGQQLGRVTRKGVLHRPGWDLTFSAPKSVSILSEVYDVQAVRDAHQAAVRAALDHIEKKRLQTRLHINGQTLRLPTDNGVFATFTHDVSRELDPQLHTHAVLINATKTPHGWRSISNEKFIDRDAIQEGGLVYRMKLAKELTDRGFSLANSKDARFWHIAGVPEELMNTFSKRSDQIHEYFDSKGIDYDSAVAKQVALLTRKSKRSIPREELSEIWKQQAAEHQLSVGLRQTIKAVEQARVAAVPSPGSGGGGSAADAAVLSEDAPGPLSPEMEATPPGRTPPGTGAAGNGNDARPSSEPGAEGEARATEHSGGGGANPQASTTERSSGAGAAGNGGSARSSSASEARRGAGRANTSGGSARGAGGSVGEPEPGARRRSNGKNHSARKYLNHAINHLLEKDMGFTELELKQKAARLGLGAVGYDELEDEIQRLKRGRHLIVARSHKERGELLTTLVAKQAELRLIRLLERGQGGLKALVGAKKIEGFLKKTNLNEQQRAAVFEALQSQGRFFGIQGDPGVGKTHTLRAYKKLLEKQGYLVKAFAPSYQATNELGKSLSVPGMVVDRFLCDPRAQREGGNAVSQVWIVDEASMLTTEQINKLMTHAHEKKARILFVGDHQQLESVGAGRGFKQLMDAGIELSTIDKRMRQKTEFMQEVVDQVMAKQYGQALETMTRAGRVVSGGGSRLNVADEFLSRTPERRKETLVVTATNAERRSINAYIRTGLKRQGVLSEKEFKFSGFQEVRLTEEEKRLASQYKGGQFVRFNANHREAGIRRHDYYQVLGVNRGENRISLRPLGGGQNLYINPAETGTDKPGGIQVFEEEKFSLAKGDRVRWLDNSNRQGLKRNTELTVLQGTPDWLRLEDDQGKRYKLPLTDLKHRHLEHYYARTAYSVQGQTSKDVLALMDSERKNTVNQRSFMVAVTRASEDAKLYVDNVQKLVKALNKRAGDNAEALTEPEFKTEVAMRRAQKAVQTRKRGFRLI